MDSSSSSPARRVIAHMDADAFYYTVEAIRDPALLGKPVIVAGNGPRAVVTTASYEARKFGVHSPMPASRARRLCPQAVLVEPHGALYRETSQRMWRIIAEQLDCPMQHVSLDEAYLDVTALEKPLAALRAAVEAVRRDVGITLSVGVGPNKLVAKTASDAEKPAGFVVLSREQAAQRFAPEPTRALQGVGPKTQERLADMGVGTIGQLQACSAVQLNERFGDRRGQELYACAFFHDDAPVVVERQSKSVSGETTYPEDVVDATTMRDSVGELAEKVSTALRRKDLHGRNVAIKIRYEDFETVTRARTVGEWLDDAQPIRDYAVELLQQHLQVGRPVRLIGVRVASLNRTDATAAELDETEELATDDGDARMDGPVQLQLPLMM